MQCKKNESPFNNHSRLEFESIPRVIPDMITCAAITFTTAEFATVRTPRSWVTHIVTSSFMKLLNQDTLLALDTAFVTILCSSIRNNSIATHGQFLEYFYGLDVRNMINRWERCQSMLIPLFNIRIGKRYTEDYWGLAVLDKQPSTLRLYDSSHAVRGFELIIPHTMQFANSICSWHEFNDSEWPPQWTYCPTVYSVQQENGYDCGIFVMMNAFYVPRGIVKPRLIPVNM